MQSGRGKSRCWILVFQPALAGSIDSLTGYTSCADTGAQVKLEFQSLEEAEGYARRAGIDYTVQTASDSALAKVSYADNFRSDRKVPWTH